MSSVRYLVLRVARSTPVVPHTVVALVLTLLQPPKEIGGAGRDHDLQPPFGLDHLLVQLGYVHVGVPRYLILRVARSSPVVSHKVISLVLTLPQS